MGMSACNRHHDSQEGAGLPDPCQPGFSHMHRHCRTSSSVIKHALPAISPAHRLRRDFGEDGGRRGTRRRRGSTILCNSKCGGRDSPQGLSRATLAQPTYLIPLTWLTVSIEVGHAQKTRTIGSMARLKTQSMGSSLSAGNCGRGPFLSLGHPEPPHPPS